MSKEDQDTSTKATSKIFQLIHQAATETTSEDAITKMGKVVDYLIEASSESVGTKHYKNSAGRIDTEQMDNETYLVILDEVSVLCDIPCFYTPDVRTENVGPEDKRQRNAFELFRKALNRKCKEDLEPHLVVVVADTTSRVENFAPTLDKYHRRLPGDSPNLFPVVNLPMYFDALVETPSDSGPFLSLQVQIRFGRPLWFHRPHLVAAKLLSEKFSQHRKHLALLGCRVPIRIRQSSLASDLIASSTAVCTSINSERDVIECEYLSEPHVSEFSVMYCIQKRISLWPAFRDAVLHRQIDTGTLGKLMAQKVLLDVFDLCTTSPDPDSDSDKKKNRSALITLIWRKFLQCDCWISSGSFFKTETTQSLRVWKMRYEIWDKEMRVCFLTTLSNSRLKSLLS